MISSDSLDDSVVDAKSSVSIYTPQIVGNLLIWSISIGEPARLIFVIETLTDGFPITACPSEVKPMAYFESSVEISSPSFIMTPSGTPVCIL